jgi:hypothetical protein
LEALRLPIIARVLPTSVLVGSAWALAWDGRGSVAAADWLPYAVGAALVLAVVILAGAAVRPDPLVTLSTAALIGLAAWDAVSLVWSPVPSLARDEALLVALYAVALLSALVTLRSDAERLAATIVVVAGLSSLAVVTAAALWFSDRPADLYTSGRLEFPVSYRNAEAAVALLAFWPAIALTARRTLPVVLRALALGGATAMLGVWLMTQSRGAGLSLALSAIVFFAVCPTRLRALVPTVIAAGLVGSGFETLTAPFRADTAAEIASAVHHAGNLTFWIAVGGVGAGLAYSLFDRYLRVSEFERRVAGALVLLTLVAALTGSLVAFFVAVDRPGHFLAKRWSHFKTAPVVEGTGTHFTSLGSNRYDFWRVALQESRRHSVAGIGARGFGAAYLVEGRSVETPARAHSVELDVLSETGIVGFVLLLAAGGLLLARIAARARGSVAAAAVLAAGVYWAAHTAVDWVWTFPAVGIPAFLLLGIGASPDDQRSLRSSVAVPACVAVLALALAGFAPPWLSARFTDRAYGDDPADAASDLRWARRLDPLSTDPLVAEAELAEPPANIRPLERAVGKEPRRAALHYLLAVAYLDAGRKDAARREFRAVLRLYPGEYLARAALRRIR